MTDKPTIVCLCGSTRFKFAWEKAILRESLAGRIVLGVACYPHAETTTLTHEERQFLDELHLRKIDLADEILVLDVRGYVGETTRAEIEYAESLGKGVRYLSQEEALMKNL
jgi:adenylosuccinate lyase